MVELCGKMHSCPAVLVPQIQICPGFQEHLHHDHVATARATACVRRDGTCVMHVRCMLDSARAPLYVRSECHSAGHFDGSHLQQALCNAVQAVESTAST